MLPNRREVLACDLDGTLLRTNSFPLYVCSVLEELHKRHDVSNTIKLIAILGERRMLRGSHIKFKSRVHSIGEVLGNEWHAHWAESVVLSFGNDRVVDLIQTWDGLKVLTTAAPAVYAAHIARLVGFDHVHASEYLQGHYNNNYGPAKVKCLKASFGTVDLAITDDLTADGPLIKFAQAYRQVLSSGELSPALTYSSNSS